MRNIFPLLIVLLVLGCTKAPVSLVPAGFDPVSAFPVQEPGTRPPILTNTLPLTPQELDAGNILLFDGVSTYGWKILEGNATLTVVRDMQSSGNLLTLLNEHKSSQKTVAIHPQGNGIITFKKEGKITVGGGEKGFENHYDFGTSEIGLKSVKAKPMNPTPLLEADWKPAAGESKAVWTDDVLELTGGLGMVETVKEYGDFVLQLEYRTDKNGTEPGVNSGVFFRCVPGETLNGYECQVFNEPPAEDYEKFIGTDTGGIFRRCVGRNVGPKDNEWNYLTIAARGPRIATWVNGIQTVDWTDTRKEDENPRKGLRLKPGTIQLQGHDPGTKIQFRNIRIAELNDENRQ